MIGILASVIDGVLVGAVYGLAAMGLTLIWGVMNVINLAPWRDHRVRHVRALLPGDRTSGFRPTPRSRSSSCSASGSASLLYWIAVHRVIGQPELMSLLATFAVNMILIGIGTALVEHEPLQRPGLAARRHWQGYTFTGTHIMAARARRR